MVTRLWVARHTGSVETRNALNVSGMATAEEMLLEGWMRLEVKNKVTMQLPRDMKPVSPLGDSYSYREAYSNGQIGVTIVYGEPIVPLRDDQSHFIQPVCESPLFVGEATYHESLIDIDGRKAKLIIDRSQPEDFVSAWVCFAKRDDNKVPLRVITYCRDDRGLEIAHQIFSSIKFKDKH